MSNIGRGETFTARFAMPKLNYKDNTEKQRLAAKRALVRGVQKGTFYVETSLSQALDQAMQSSSWGPFSPKFPYARKNGTIVGKGTRNLIDTGALMRSKQIKSSFTQNSSKIDIYYRSPYANLVHFGGAIQPWGNPKAATVILPARPWIQAVLLGGIGSIPKADIDTQMNKGVSEVWKETFG